MKNLISGRIIKGIGGFYYVKPDGSDSLYECKARGAFRHQKMVPTVGDFVEFEENAQGENTIEGILTRKNIFVRPPVANVDIALIIFAAVNPEPNLLLLDKLLIASEVNGVKPVICFSKTDLVESAVISEYRQIYAASGYPVLGISTEDKATVAAIEGIIGEGTAFMAGPSGVGKSTLANRLCSETYMETGILSRKLSRGKHTTRHVELLKLRSGGYLLDTPGFSSLKLDENLETETLRDYFPEFEGKRCKFKSCLHQNEPGCGVKESVQKGEIAKKRYEHYLYLLEELKNKRSRY